MDSRLSPLQARILSLVAGFSPPWRLTGGGALVGFHLGHRTTRDLDLFFHGRTTLESIPHELESTLRATWTEASVHADLPPSLIGTSIAWGEKETKLFYGTEGAGAWRTNASW